MLPIIFEDDYCIVVHKPNNMLVHHSNMANNQLHELSLVQLLTQELKQRFYPVHRLDRKTSGLILFAKQKEFIKLFQDLFINNKIEKTYFGLVRGFIPEEGKINSPVKGRDANVYKEALTLFERTETYEVSIPVGPYQNARYSLVKLTPKTGRLHQLRIHMNKISHPLIGDPKYGDRFHNRMFQQEFNCTTLFLHANTLTFTHPYTQQKHCLTSKLPEHWNTIINRLKEHKV